MHFWRESVLLGALLANFALAKDKCSEFIEIRDQSDADKLKSCKTFAGDVRIDHSFQGSVNLDGLEEIQGYLWCGHSAGRSDNGSVTSISSSTLRSIDDRFELTLLPSLDSISLPALREVMTIDWEGLPKLKTVDFGDGLDKVGNVTLKSTNLTDVSPLATEKVRNWSISDHPSLKVADLRKITTYEKFAATSNNKTLEVVLSGVTAAGMTTLGNLKLVNLNSLETTTETIYISGYLDESLTFPALRHAAGINMELDIKYLKFPVLETIHGDFDVRVGDAKISLPSLEGVDGDFVLNIDDAKNCTVFSDFKVSGSQYYCQSNGTTHHYNLDADYSNSAPNVSVGVPDNETFGTENGAVGRGGLWAGLSMVVPLLAAMAVVL